MWEIKYRAVDSINEVLNIQLIASISNLDHVVIKSNT